jgi:hypothetical protein
MLTLAYQLNDLPMTTISYPVSERALFQRINRALNKNDEKLCKCRLDSRAYYDLGDYYRIDCRTNFVLEKHVDLEEMARDLNVMHPREVLIESHAN